MTMSNAEAEFKARIENDRLEAESIYKPMMAVMEAKRGQPAEGDAGYIFANAVEHWFKDVWIPANSERLYQVLDYASKHPDESLEDGYNDDYHVVCTEAMPGWSHYLFYKLSWGCREAEFNIKFLNGRLDSIQNSSKMTMYPVVDNPISAGYLLDAVGYIEALVMEKTV
jgi:hypothetical protein